MGGRGGKLYMQLGWREMGSYDEGGEGWEVMMREGRWEVVHATGVRKGGSL